MLLRIKARVPRYARRTVKCIRYVLTLDILVLELAGTGRTHTTTHPTHLGNQVPRAWLKDCSGALTMRPIGQAHGAKQMRTSAMHFNEQLHSRRQATNNARQCLLTCLTLAHTRVQRRHRLLEFGSVFTTTLLRRPWGMVVGQQKATSAAIVRLLALRLVSKDSYRYPPISCSQESSHKSAKCRKSVQIVH